MTIIPRDPLALPPPERREAALALLKTLRPLADEIELDVSETPEFFDATGHFENIFCPFCAKELEISWWHEKMDAWWDGDRRVLAIETPCCGRATSLNDLDYGCEQGYACFGIKLMNPSGDLEPEEVRQIEETLGMPIRVVWCHI
jgi:hypothetical protein